MNKNLKKTLASLSISISLVLINQPANAAGDPGFINFALDQAHKRGFDQCDKAISATFDNAGGSDIRIDISTLPTTKDTIRMTTVYGYQGDSVFMDSIIRKVGAQCILEQSTMVSNPKPCAEAINQTPAFKQEAVTVGTVWAKSPGGVLAVYHPKDNSCVITYRRTMSY